MAKILCICLSSTIQRGITFEKVELTKVNRSHHYVQHASGKAINSARVLNQLEKDCAVSICPVGKENKKLFLQLAKNDNLPLKTVTIPGFTRECWTLLDSNNLETTELVVGEPIISLGKNILRKKENQIFKLIKNQLKKCQGVLLAGSRPQIWSDDLYQKIAMLCLQNKKIFLADYIGSDMEKTLEKCTPSIIKINDEEFIKTFGLTDSDDESLKNQIINKSRQLNNMIIVTRGTKPTFGANKGDFAQVDVEKVHAINTTACGDSFNAGFLYEYLNSADFVKAMEKGTWCASRNAENEAPGSVY